MTVWSMYSMYFAKSQAEYVHQWFNILRKLNVSFSLEDEDIAKCSQKALELIKPDFQFGLKIRNKKDKERARLETYNIIRKLEDSKEKLIVTSKQYYIIRAMHKHEKIVREIGKITKKIKQLKNEL